MEEIYHTLHEYLLHTESITYLIIVVWLIGIIGFVRFLTERDED